MAKPKKQSGKPKSSRSSGSEPPRGYQPPRGITPPAESIPPPGPHRERLLPLVSVGSVRFEHLCEDILTRAFPEVVRTSLKRTQGVEQYGVDVEGFDDNGDTAVVVSAKCYHVIRAWDFRPWLQDFLDHIEGHWRGKGVKHFVLAVTHECNDDDMNASAKALVAELKARGITFRLWNTRFISDLLSKDVTLVDRYFNRYWVDTISAAVRAGSPTVAGAANLEPTPALAAAAQLLHQALGHVASGTAERLDNAMAARLEDALAALRAGRSADLRTWLVDARHDPGAWTGLSAATRAKAVRADAMLHLRVQEVGPARALLDEADSLSPAPDASARALLARLEGTVADALALLAEPTSVREHELKAGLLIEADRAAEAAALLGSLSGADVSPEVLRLRAIAHLVLGNRREALQDATSAVERVPHDVLPLFTLGTIRLFSSLAEGVEPQFGGMPHPINPGLVRDTREARDLLAQAVADFERLLLVAEPPLKADVEVWKLAALLLHPERRDEAARYAEQLLERDDPEPVAVAWAANFGVLRRAGRIKKTLGDTVRQGRGTPTHLVVLALLSAGNEHPERGLALVKRYADRFPEAQNFLRGWRVQLGDLSIATEDSYPVAVHRSLQEGNNEPLLALLADPGASVENLLSGAEFLAWRSAWVDLDRLRPQLQAMRTTRATELAAFAALRSGHPADCLAILKEAETVFEGGRLPRRLIYLRIRANEEMGQHRPVIADLIAIRREGQDPHIDHRLMDAYLRIGALPELQAEAESALAEGRLDAEQALRVAYVLRAHAPATARRALLHATQQGLRPEAAGAALSLAAELGLSDVQNRMMRVLTSSPGEGGRVITFRSVEDVLAFLNDRSREYRETFDGWLRGRSPAALAMDLKTFGRLFLAESDERTNEVGDAFPMLLLSGATREPPAELTEDRPTLRVDLSALLLASRLGIVVALEEAFAIQVPESVAEALIELEAKFARVDQEIVRASTDALTPGRSAVRMVEEAPAGARSVESTDDPGTLDGAVVRRLLDQAFRAGHIGRDEVERAAATLSQTAAAQDEVAAATLTSATLTQLAAAGVLEPIARGTPVFMSAGEADRLRRALKSAVHEDNLRSRVAALRSKMAERLAAGAWTSVPRLAAPEQEASRAPAHVRCVREIISAQTRAPEAFWIEDRFLSHRRLERALYVTDVVDRLHARGIIDAQRRARILRVLRETGYAFLPLDVDEFRGKIEAAPVHELSLLETPDLSDLRAWFARELGRLVHVDTTVQQAQDGSVAGEVRRILDVGGLARALLSGIWADPNATVDEKQARADWVWTSLRFERAPTLPAGVTAEAQRHYVAMTVVHVLDVPLFEALGSHEGSHWQDFVNWFMAVAVKPLAKADPAAGEVMVGLLASIVSQLLDRPDDLDHDPALAEAVRREFVVIARRFLDLLPRDWRRRIVERETIKDRLEEKTVTVMTVAEDVEVPVEALADGYGRALAEPDGADAAAAVELISGDEARLEIGASSDPVRPATLVVGERRVAFDVLHSALLHPDEAARVTALRSAEVDLRGSIGREDLIRVAELGAVEDRFAAWKELVDGDFHRRMKTVRARAAARDPISVSDLDLPSPKALAAFLRIAPLEDADPARLIAAVADGLWRDLDAEEAERRLAGMPLEVPNDRLAGIGRRLLQVEPGARGGPTESPLLALLRLRAMAAAGADEETLNAAVQALVSAWRNQGDLFVALVRRGAGQALKHPDWGGIGHEVRVAFLWIYADQVTQALALPGLDARRVADWVRERTGQDLIDHERQAALPGWVSYLTAKLDREHFGGMLLIPVLRDRIADRVSPDNVQSLKDVVGQEGFTAWSPFFDLISPPPAAPEAFWPSADAFTEMENAGWLPEGHLFAARNNSGLANRLLEEGIDPGFPTLVPALLSFVDVEDVDPAILPRIKVALDTAGAEAVLEPELGAVQRILSVRAVVLGRLNELEPFQKVLREQAARCAEKWPHDRLPFEPNGTPAALALGALVNAAWMHGKALPRPPDERLARFADGARTVVDVWPNAVRGVIGLLDQVVRQLDIETAGAVWPVLLDLRTRL
jgi:tetratricopeptide (TPR) repeat protein